VNFELKRHIQGISLILMRTMFIYIKKYNSGRLSIHEFAVCATDTGFCLIVAETEGFGKAEHNNLRNEG